MACVVVFDRTPAVFRCTICGGEAPLPLPLQVSQVLVLSEKFTREHRTCRQSHLPYSDPQKADKP